MKYSGVLVSFMKQSYKPDRGPRSPSENGFMEPKYYAFVSVIGHPNHHMRISGLMPKENFQDGKPPMISYQQAIDFRMIESYHLDLHLFNDWEIVGQKWQQKWGRYKTHHGLVFALHIRPISIYKRVEHV